MMGINAKEAQHTLVGVASTAFLWHIWEVVLRILWPSYGSGQEQLQRCIMRITGYGSENLPSLSSVELAHSSSSALVPVAAK